VKAIKAFNVGVVIVLDFEKLENDIKIILNDPSINIIQLPKSGGIT
jgi:hypothetical protein